MINLEKEMVLKDSTIQNNEKENGLPINEVSLFSQKVLKKMKYDKVPPTPYNFQIYFESMLEKTDNEYKQNMETIQKKEANTNNEKHHIEIEKEMKEGFSSVKSMIQSISSTYKNISLLKQHIKKKNTQISTTNNQIAMTNIISSLKNDITKFDILISKQLDILKKDYEKTVLTLKSMESKAIYDTRYDIYNKKYLLERLSTEHKACASQKVKSSLLALKIKDTILNNGLSGKNQFLLNKNISKLLQKTSRRSDIVSHYGDGVFFILLKHTNIDEAKLACQRIAALIYGSSFFIEGADIRMDLEIAATDINAQLSTEESIALLLNALPQSSRDGSKYKIAQSTQTQDDEESFE